MEKVFRAKTICQSNSGLTILPKNWQCLAWSRRETGTSKEIRQLWCVNAQGNKAGRGQMRALALAPSKDALTGTCTTTQEAGTWAGVQVSNTQGWCMEKGSGPVRHETGTQARVWTSDEQDWSTGRSLDQQQARLEYGQEFGSATSKTGTRAGVRASTRAGQQKSRWQRGQALRHAP